MFEDLRISAEFQAKRFGYGLAGDIVLGGPKTADEDQQSGAKQSVLRHSEQVLMTVPDDGFLDDPYAQLIQLFGEVE